MSTSTAALPSHPTGHPPELPAWKAELNAKLEAHRQRRGLGSSFPEDRAMPEPRDSEPSGASHTTAARVAARVAERYAKAPSYSEVLAANAAAAAALADMAVAAAAVAEAHHAAHQAAHELIADIADMEERELDHRLLQEADDAARTLQAGPGYLRATVEHPQPLPPRASLPERPASGARPMIVDAFAEAEVPPATQLPAKLIEFPRELVAARKSRPRHAEGPLADALLEPFEGPADGLFEAAVSGEQAADSSALRIFEVQDAAGQAGRLARSDDSSAREPQRRQEPGAASRAPEWHSIRLGEHPSSNLGAADEEIPGQRRPEPKMSPTLPLHVASLADRGMAALVDLAVITAAFLLFVLVFASCTAHPPLDKAAFAAGGLVFALVAIFYEWLLLSYGVDTLGMRYAQVALCTFDDENPTRSMRRRRVWASLLASVPLGLGLVWAIFDDDALGWHDRMTRTYQRSYR